MVVHSYYGGTSEEAQSQGELFTDSLHEGTQRTKIVEAFQVFCHVHDVNECFDVPLYLRLSDSNNELCITHLPRFECARKSSLLWLVF